jgi:hypothetical protein
MHPELSSFLPVADIDFGRSFGVHMLPLEVGTNAEHRTGSPLTFATMAGDYGIGIGGNLRHAKHHKSNAWFSSRYPSVIRLSETTIGRASERPLDGRSCSC